MKFSEKQYRLIILVSYIALILMMKPIVDNFGVAPLVVGFVSIFVIAAVHTAKKSGTISRQSLNLEEENIIIPDLPDIDDVKEVTSSLFIRGEYRNNLILRIFIAFSLSIISYFIISHFILSELVFWSFAPLVYPYYYYLKIKSSVLSAFIKQFALVNNYTYKKTEKLEKRYGVVFNRGRGRFIYNVVEGNFLKKHFKLFNYEFTTGSGKHQTTHYYTVFEIVVDASLPQIYLDAYGKYEMPTSNSLRGLKKIELESNEFNKEYRLYMAKGAHLPVFQIFTPDLMAELIDIPEKFDIEFVGNRIYLYEEKLITTKRELEEMYKLMQHLIKNLSRVVERIR